MSEAFIICDGLVKIYKVADLEVVALQGLNLTVERNELMGIVGASGSGKSTLMNILGGLDRPTAGRVDVDGHNLLKISDTARNRYRREKVGFVWQQSARNLVPYLNALDNVMLPMTLAGASGRHKRERAEYLLDLVELSDRTRHHLSELSGGQQQRVAIAVGLANSPTLLLADEPTGEVDSGTALTIYRTFQMLVEKLDVTILIVSHDPAIARHVGRVVAIRDGMLASETVRQAQPEGTPGNDAAANGTVDYSHDKFEELVVLDSAGRLHVPKDYLELFDIKGRARLEVTDEGILIRPAAHSAPTELRPQMTAATEEGPSSRPRGLRGMLSHVRGKRRG